jgi:hypothetical protein
MARYQAEVDAMAVLESESPWLSGIHWKIEGGGRLVCEAELLVNGKQLPAMVRYNEGFPNTPPSVLPRVDERWSGHQYGKGGELCLAYRADNWVPTVTGATMLTNAYDLLVAEAADESGLAPQLPVPSAHALTIGQELRTEKFRLFYTSEFQAQASAQAGTTPARFCFHGRNEYWIGYAVAIAGGDAAEWIDPAIPTTLVSADVAVEGFVIPGPVDLPSDVVKSAKLLRQHALGADVATDKNASSEILFFAGPQAIRAFFLWYEKDLVVEFAMIAPDPAARIYPEYAALAERRVGLIGCGSVGGKVAASLVRAGVGRMLLVDDDVFRMENLVRNELDWSNIGEHKVEGLARRLKLLRAGVTVDVRRQRFGGQEAGSTVHGTMKALSQCDLIIDATAEGQSFNFAAAAAVEHDKPMVWAEVYAGGIGGLIARSRPGIEPTPQYARNRLLHWCAQQDGPVPTSPSRKYEGGEEGAPQIADDADVAVIAAHLARMAIDTLLARTPSCFPHSAYLIGLQEKWIFTQPFDTIPVDLGGPEAVAPDADPAKEKEGFEGILQLLKDRGA